MAAKYLGMKYAVALSCGTVALQILAHLYGVSAKMDEIVKVRQEHGALIVEDVAEAMGVRYNGQIVSGMCGSFGDFAAISFNGNNVFEMLGDVDFCNKVTKKSA